jgi:hypothetical protein
MARELSQLAILARYLAPDFAGLFGWALVIVLAALMAVAGGA